MDAHNFIKIILITTFAFLILFIVVVEIAFYFSGIMGNRQIESLGEAKIRKKHILWGLAAYLIIITGTVVVTILV